MAKRPLPFHARPARPRGWAGYSRKTASQRGYGAEWQRLRREMLAQEPLCRECQKHDAVTLATELDHITPKHLGGTDERSNLQPLCRPCHAAKTAREGHARRTDHA